MNTLRKKSLVQYFLITFAFTWGFWLIAVLHSAGVFSLPFPVITIVGIGAHGPLVSALIRTGKSGGKQKILSFLKSGFNLRMKPLWWIALLAYPVVFAVLAVNIRSSVSSFTPDRTLLSQPLMILPTFFFLMFLGGSFQEEYGWRGYALPKMLVTMSPFTASLVLGAFWGIWHLPLFYIEGLSQSNMQFPVFFLLTLCFSILFTDAYLRTGGNLFSAILLHTTINASLSLFPPIELSPGGDRTAMAYLLVIYAAAAAAMVLRDPSRWFEKPKHSS